MRYLKSINSLRRNFTKLVTRTIGKSDLNKQPIAIDVKSIKRVLITRPNHRLGNMLLITPIVKDVSNTFPDCKIDLFVKGGVAAAVFENYENVDKIIALPKSHFKNLHEYLFCWFYLKIQKYDLVINAVAFSSSGKLSTKLANSKYKFFGSEIKEDIILLKEEEKHVTKSTIINLRNFLAQSGIVNKELEFPNIDIKLCPIEISNGKKELERLIKGDKKTISIFTFATGDKCYSEKWWNDFYDLLKLTFPTYTIIEILPIEKISKINYKAPSYYSKNIRQIAALIANTDLFIGADSGMMHLANASQITTVGLFSVTNPLTFGPYGNNSLAINTNEMKQEEFIEIIKSLFK